MLNAAVLVECKTIKHVVSSAAEAEVAGLFHNAATALEIRGILIKLGHQQLPTPIKTENTTVAAFVYDNIHQKRSKIWDMRYYWFRDRMNQLQFNIFWESGKMNHTDYYTKHHPTIYHRNLKGRYTMYKET